MDNGKNSLIDVFSRERFFIIPSYQRSYAWDEKQQRDFFEDFKNDYNKTNYYYGTILLQKTENENVFEIVDGQQRITTLVIFIYCLIKELRKRNDINNEIWNSEDIDDWEDLEKKFIKFKGNYKLTLQSQENNFFHSCILNDNQEEDFEIETPSQQRLKNAKNNFERWLKNVNIDKLKILVTNISKAQSLIYIIKDKNEASLIFETTNDRGKPLTNLEKIKSYLMYKVSSTKDKPDQLLSKIEDTFNKVYRDYEKIENKQIDEDSILGYNFIANEEWNNEGGKKYQHYIEELKVKIEKLIEEEQKNKKDNEENSEYEEYKKLREYIERYLSNIQFSYDHFARIILKPCEEFNDISALGRMASFYPLFLKGYRLDTTKEKKLFRKLCRICEIFIFRNLVILHNSSNKYQTKFYEIAKNFGNFSSDKFEDVVKGYNDLYEEIAGLTLSLGNDEKFINELSSNDFFHVYRTSDKNYFFWKYENWLRSKDGQQYTLLSYEDLINKDPKLKFSTEHIVAQSNEEQKENIIKNCNIIKIENKEDFDKKYLHSIGNLTIDPQSSNSSKGKKPVEEKNSKYFSKAPYMSQNELENFLDNVNEQKIWTIRSIEKRKKAILNFAYETWCEPIKRIKITDEEIKNIQYKMKDEDDLDEELEIDE